MSYDAVKLSLRKSVGCGVGALFPHNPKVAGSNPALTSLKNVMWSINISLDNFVRYVVNEFFSSPMNRCIVI